MLNLKGPSMGISGRFKLDVLNSKGKLVKDKCLPEQKNLITETGLQRMLTAGTGLSAANMRLMLGTGSTPPQREDIRLDNTLAASPSNVNFTDATALSDTSFQVSKEFTFNLGQVVGNITELGLSHNYTNLSSYSLITRALIKDASGNATSIEILADEQIKITYILSLEIEETSEPFTISVNKDGVLEDHTITPMFGLRRISSLAFFPYFGTSTSYRMSAGYGNNTGSVYSNSVAENGAFSADRKTYTKEFKGFAGIDRWNDGIQWVGVTDHISQTHSSSGSTSRFDISNGTVGANSETSFVWRIDPPITKTEEQVIEITCTVSVTYGD